MHFLEIGAEQGLLNKSHIMTQLLPVEKYNASQIITRVFYLLEECNVCGSIGRRVRLNVRTSIGATVMTRPLELVA